IKMTKLKMYLMFFFFISSRSSVVQLSVGCDACSLSAPYAARILYEFSLCACPHSLLQVYVQPHRAQHTQHKWDQVPSGVPSRVPPYIRCPQQSPSLHRASPAESLLTPGIPSKVPPYTRHSQQNPSLHQVPPAESLHTSGVPSRVPPYIRCPQWSPSLHQVPPVESLLTSGAPSRVPPYIRCPQ
ncbi:hypothetical protein AB205_0029030, partial [Aquarana catesbeiana]